MARKFKIQNKKKMNYFGAKNPRFNFTFQRKKNFGEKVKKL